MTDTTDTPSLLTTEAASPEAAATPPAPAPEGAPPAQPGTAAAAPTEAPEAEAAAKTEEAAAKPEGEKPAAEYNLTLPEGVEADTALLDGFTNLAKETGLPPETAQRVVDMYVAQQQAAAKAQAEAYDAQQTQWVESLRTSKDVGGANFDSNVKTALRAVEKFGGPELKQALNETGLGNHPALVRFALRVGQAMADDSVAGATGQQPSREDTERERLARLYPTMKREE